MKKKLTKSRDNVVLTGTLGGIAEYFNIDATIVRIIFAVIFFFGWGSPVLLYILLAMIIPKAPITRNSKGQDSYSKGNPYDYGQPFYNRNQTDKATKRKEAEKIDDDDDQWSDF